MRKACYRCLHIWEPESDDPVRCPKCGSPYWNKPRSRPAGRQDAIAHWQRVAREYSPQTLQGDYAREALSKLGAEPDRIPGEDDQ